MCNIVKSFRKNLKNIEEGPKYFKTILVIRTVVNHRAGGIINVFTDNSY